VDGAKHVARNEGKGRMYRVLMGGNLKEKASLEHLDVDRRIILKFILKK